jgi:hypothetical protein
MVRSLRSYIVARSKSTPITSEYGLLSRRTALLGGAATLTASSAAAAYASAEQVFEHDEWSSTMDVQDLADRWLIQQTLIHYCHAVDDHSWEELADLFTPDAEFIDVTIGAVPIAEFLDFLPKALAKVKIAQHGISTTRIEVSGNTAEARSVCNCPMVVVGPDGKDHAFYQGLWYEDELRRVDGRWLISRRSEVGYWVDGMPKWFSFD